MSGLMFASQDWHGVDAWLYNWNCVIAGVVTNRGFGELVSPWQGDYHHSKCLRRLRRIVAPKCPHTYSGKKSPNELRRRAA